MAANIIDLIDSPRSKLRGIIDPVKDFFNVMLANPAASSGECARRDSILLAIVFYKFILETISFFLLPSWKDLIQNIYKFV